MELYASLPPRTETEPASPTRWFISPSHVRKTGHGRAEWVKTREKWHIASLSTDFLNKSEYALECPFAAVSEVYSYYSKRFK